MTGFVDVHCHVLPGVDDGAPDLAASLDFLRLAAASGTAEIIATPHQHPGRYPNDAATLGRAHDVLQAAIAEARASGESLPAVHLGAEVHLDAGLPALVAAGERLRLAGGACLLLELPDMFPIKAIEELVFELQVAGVVPVLAHPERIGQFLRQPEQLRGLVERGAIGQATGSSVAGVFGEPCRAVTEQWLREGLLHVVASDAHDLVRRTPDLSRAAAELDRLFGEPWSRAFLSDRPRALLAGRPCDTTPPPPPAPEPAPRKSSWRRWFGG